MRRKIAAGNWKMNTTLSEGKELLDALSSHDIPSNVEVILCVPSTHLSTMAGKSDIAIGAQNMYYEDNGAFTGEISPLMLKDLNVNYVLIGHSERREYFNETNEILAKKLNKALEHNLLPIFCCGEPLEIRKEETHVSYVKRQLEEGLFHLSPESMTSIILAYEPIWAIGTGETASPKQAQDMHEAIRNMITEKYGREIGDKVPILYGGSVKPGNATDLFSKKDVDGGLVGGASLDPESFSNIANSFE